MHSHELVILITIKHHCWLLIINLHPIEEQVRLVKVSQSHDSADLPIEVQTHFLKIMTRSCIHQL